MKKKIISISLVVALVAVTLVGASLAYFTDSKNKTNTFTVGNVKIQLTEPNWEASGKLDAPEVFPGEALHKDPTVTNVGANPCFVRIKVEGLDSLGTDLLIKYRTNYTDGQLGTDWVLHTDGYFYYTKVLGTDEQSDLAQTTDALFDQIVMPTALTNGDADTDYNVQVTAEAVQAQGAKASFAAVKAMTVAEIKAWFTTCGL